jgi:hypothetical protein
MMMADHQSTRKTGEGAHRSRAGADARLLGRKKDDYGLKNTMGTHTPLPTITHNYTPLHTVIH